MTTTEKKGRFSMPCPDLPKGSRCHLCGGTYICLQPNRPKVAQAKTLGGKQPGQGATS